MPTFTTTSTSYEEFCYPETTIVGYKPWKFLFFKGKTSLVKKEIIRSGLCKWCGKSEDKHTAQSTELYHGIEVKYGGRCPLSISIKKEPNAN